MSKFIENLEGPVLGMQSSSDMYEKLKYESDRLQKDWKNSYDIFNFLVTAWHLFNDWQKSDPSKCLSRIRRGKSQLPAEMLFVMDVVRDLTNGSKHFELDLRAANRRVVSETHTGDEIGFYQYFFRERLPGVNAEDANFRGYFSIRVLHNIIMRYFQWVFDNNLSESKFPEEITEAIKYCDIANRPNMITSAARELC